MGQAARIEEMRENRKGKWRARGAVVNGEGKRCHPKFC